MHPEREAESTCKRCGRYVCASCMSSGGLCWECVRQNAAAVPSAQIRARRATLFLHLWGVVETCNMLLILLSALAMGGEDSIESLETLSTLGALLNAVGVVIFPVTPIVFLMWLHRVVRQMNAWGRDVGATPAWAVGCWFVPFVNLVVPFRVMRSIVDELGDEPLADSLPLGVWACTFVLSRVLGRLGAYLSSAILMMDVWYVQLVNAVAIVASSCTLVAAFLCARIVLEVQARLDSLENGLSSSFR